MTDAEAQIVAPPAPPVDDKPQVERKIIGGCINTLTPVAVFEKTFQEVSVSFFHRAFTVAGFALIFLEGFFRERF